MLNAKILYYYCTIVDWGENQIKSAAQNLQEFEEVQQGRNWNFPCLIISMRPTNLLQMSLIL